MNYYKFQHKEHSYAGGYVTCYYEVDINKDIARSIEFRPDGSSSKYGEDILDDEFGGLPDQKFNPKDATELGTLSKINKEFFNERWFELKEY